MRLSGRLLCLAQIVLFLGLFRSSLCLADNLEDPISAPPTLRGVGTLNNLRETSDWFAAARIPYTGIEPLGGGERPLERWSGVAPKAPSARATAEQRDRVVP